MKNKINFNTNIPIPVLILILISISCCCCYCNPMSLYYNKKAEENLTDTSQEQEITKPVTIPVTEKVTEPATTKPITSSELHNLLLYKSVIIENVEIVINSVSNAETKSGEQIFEVNVTYKNNSGQPLKISSSDWATILKGGIHSQYIKGGSLTEQTIEDGEEYTGTVFLSNDSETKSIIFKSHYLPDAYATWVVPEDILVMTTETSEFELTQLYLDFFEPYINSIGKLTPQAFKQDNSEKFADYDVNIREGNEEDLWKFEIKDSNNNYMTFWFLPDNDMYENPPEDWNWTLCLITYDNENKEISISDNLHNNSAPVYNTSDKNREKVKQEVKSIDELKKFMFIAKENLTETITTAIVTEPPTEPAVEPPTPAPTNPPTEPPPPPAPVVAECDFVLNTSTMKAHYPDCRDVDRIDPENRWDYYGTVEDVQSMGYSSCGHCHTW